MHWSSHSFWFSFTDFELRTTCVPYFQCYRGNVISFSLNGQVTVPWSHCKSDCCVLLWSCFIKLIACSFTLSKCLCNKTPKHYEKFHSKIPNLCKILHSEKQQRLTLVRFCATFLLHWQLLSVWPPNFEGLTATHMTLQSCCVGVRP